MAPSDLSEHLGGYVAGGDSATFYPHLWEWLIRELGVRSVLDVGCGDGIALSFFAGEIAKASRSAPSRVLGIDGVAQPNPRIVQHDYIEGPYVPPYPLFDLCWSCEFVEHVEEQYVPNFLASFAHAELLLMTHAEPGQDGHHHVNCQPADYWIGRVAEVGFRLDGKLTTVARALAGANLSPWNHFRRSGLAFRRQP